MLLQPNASLKSSASRKNSSLRLHHKQSLGNRPNPECFSPSLVSISRTPKLVSQMHRLDSYGRISTSSFSPLLNCEQLLTRMNKRKKLNSINPITPNKISNFSQRSLQQFSTSGNAFPNRRAKESITISPTQNNSCRNRNRFNTGSAKKPITAFNTVQTEEICLKEGLTKEDKQIIENVIQKHIFFKHIPQDAFDLLINEFFSFTYENNKTIYEQGEEGNYFYIIGKGTVKGISTVELAFNSNINEGTINNEINDNTDIYKDNTGIFSYNLDNNDIENGNQQFEIKERIYETFSSFGEQALMSKLSREETIKTVTNVKLFALDGDIFRQIRSSFNESSLKEKYSFLNTISTFRCLDNVSKYNVANRLKIKEFNTNEVIIRYNEIGETLYIIKDGLVSCRIGSNEIRKMASKEFFGQNAVLIDMKRACDVIALKKTICYELSRNDLKEALGVDYVNVILFAYFQNCIMNNNFFKDVFIDFKQLELFETFNINHYGFKEKLVNPLNIDQSSRRIVIIIDGGLFRETESKQLEVYARKGEIIGEELLKEASYELSSDIIAYPDCISLEANISNVCKILNLNIMTVIAPQIDTVINITRSETLTIYDKISSLKKVHLFKHLSDNTLTTISKAMIQKKYNYEEIIVKEGDIGNSLFIIANGRVRIIQNDTMIRDLDSGNCFGEIAMLKEGVKRTATVIAIENNVICYEISKTDLDKYIVNEDIKIYMQKKMALRDTSIKLNDLYYIKFLGKGKFGNVNLVHNKTNLYAIKQVSRKAVLNEKVLAQYFTTERKIMLSLDHPFIVKLVKTLKNDLYCFYLMEYIKGKNFRAYLSRATTPKLNIPNTRFYVGSILIMIEYLHRKYIAHRDIKPSNIMIDANGYLKLIDFGTAKLLYDYTNTTIGTPHYMAPEVLKGKCYSLSCDFWSIGICMYEIFYGCCPFGKGAKDVMEIYQEIIYKDLYFPVHEKEYEHVNNLLSELLMKKVNKRTCKVRLLKKTKFFEGFNWDSLIEFQMKPPFIPKITKTDKELLSKVGKPFENMIKEDNTQVKQNVKGVKGMIWKENWADEF